MHLKKPLLPKWDYWPAIAFAILVGLAAVGWSYEPPSQPHQQAAYNDSGNKGWKMPALEWPLKGWVADDYIAAFTGLTAIVFFGQLLAMWRTNRHFHASERAYVKMSHYPPGIEWAKNTGIIRLRIKNFGSTPADVTDTVFTHRVTGGDEDDLPESPPYDVDATDRLPQQFFLVKEDKFNFTETVTVSLAEKQAIMTGKRLLVVFGYVDYRDKFGARHRAGYARMYDPTIDKMQDLVDIAEFDRRNNLPNFPHRFYNYDQLRKPREGNDWPD